MTRVVVPYHHAEPMPHLADAFAGDAIVVSRGETGAMVRRIHEQLAQRVAAAGEPVVIASGDCTTAVPVVAGLQRRGDVRGAIWIDAHAGFETAQTAVSGDLCRMALAMLVGRTGPALRAASGLVPLAGADCVLAAARSVSARESDALTEAGVRRIGDLALLVRADLPPPPWYVHVDLDVLDPAALPGLRFPEPGGPPARSLAPALADLRERGAIAAIGFACTLAPSALRSDDQVALLGQLLATIWPAATVGKYP